MKKKKYYSFFELAGATRFHHGLIEIHVDQALIGLRNAVLKTRRNLQFIGFNRQNQVSQIRLWDGDAIECHQGPHARRNDGTGPRQAHKVRNVRIIAQREIALMQDDALLAAMIIKTLHRRL